jgi:hypothetical protein
MDKAKAGAPSTAPSFQIDLEARIKSLGLAERPPVTPVPVTPGSSAEEIAAKLSNVGGRLLTYAENAALFDQWWKLLPEQLKRELASSAEQFRTLNDYWEQLFRSEGVPGVPVTILPEMYSRFVDEAPRIPQSLYGYLLAVSENGPSETKHEHIRAALGQHLREYEEYLNQHFGLDGKPSINEDRDRRFSRLSHEGQSYRKIWRECGDRTLSSKDAVRQPIKRSRKARERDSWAIRLSIFVTNFPRISCLACDQCFGTSEAPHESWSPAQREWYEKWCKIGWNRRPLTEYAPDEGCAPIVPCPRCDGTGKLKASQISPSGASK